MLVTMTFASLWKKAVEESQPADIDNLTDAETAQIKNAAETFGPRMSVGYPLITFSDGSTYNLETREVA